MTVVSGDRGLVLRFGKRAAGVYREIAGSRVDVGCTKVTRTLGGYSVREEGWTTLRAPRRRGPLPTRTRGKFDYCFVRLHARPNPDLAVAPISRAGRTYLDERTRAALLMLPFTDSAEARDDRPPTTEEVIADSRGLVVVLDGPDGVPPKGKVGYWTDGARVVTAVLTLQGRRLFLRARGRRGPHNILVYLVN